jgi:hypothetical protein
MKVDCQGSILCVRTRSARCILKVGCGTLPLRFSCVNENEGEKECTSKNNLQVGVALPQCAGINRQIVVNERVIG